MRLREGVAALLLATAAGPVAADGLAGLGPVGGLALPPGLAAAGTELAGAALAALIREGMAEAAWFGLDPLDPMMRARMARDFPAESLDRVRWAIVAPGSHLAAAIFAPGPVDAVTLGDVIVFRDAAAAGDARLTAHELAHVLQYERLGLDGFARAYVTDAAGMEAEAHLIAEIWAADAAPSGPPVSPRPVRRPGG